MTNLQRYNQVFINVFGVNENLLNEEFTFKGTAVWDSVAHLSLITELEDTFDVMFESEDILHFESYDNGKRILGRLGIIID